MRGEPWRRKYASPGHPPGDSSAVARGGSAATRATSKVCMRRLAAAESNQLACLGSSAMLRSNRFRSAEKNARAIRASNGRLGGSCTSRHPRRVPRGARSARKLSSSFALPASRWSCVIVRGIFTDIRNARGTLSAHRSNVDARCGRLNVELISTAGSACA